MNARAAFVLILFAAAITGCTRTVPADVKSFVARVHRTALDPEHHDPRAMELYQEAEFLRERYAAVGQWPSLEAARRELAAYLNVRPPELARWRDKTEELRRDLVRSLNLEDFRAASCRLDDFGRRFGEERDSALAMHLEQERELLSRWSVVWAKRQCSDAHFKRGQGRKDEARRLLISAYDELKGFADAREQVREALKEIGE